MSGSFVALAMRYRCVGVSFFRVGALGFSSLAWTSARDVATFATKRVLVVGNRHPRR